MEYTTASIYDVMDFEDTFKPDWIDGIDLTLEEPPEDDAYATKEWAMIESKLL